MQAVGELVLEDSASLGDQAADDIAEALHELGAQIIEQKAEDIARQAEIYLATNPGLSLGYLQNDLFFEQIVVQELGGGKAIPPCSVPIHFIFFTLAEFL